MALHVCPYCDKTYTRFSILRNHLKKHSGDKPFKCSKCELAFGRRWDLKQHELTHDLSGSYKYKCQGEKDGVKWGCGVGFHRNYDLQRHINRPTGQRCRQPKQPEGRVQDDGREAAEVLTALKHGDDNQDSDMDKSCLTILQPALHTLYKTHQIFKKSVTVLYIVLQTPEGKRFEAASSSCDGLWMSTYQLLRDALVSGMDDALALCILVLVAIELAWERYEGIFGHIRGLRVWAIGRLNSGHDSGNDGASQVASTLWQYLYANNGSVTEVPKLAANDVVARLLFRSTPGLDVLFLVQSMLAKADKYFDNDSRASASDPPSQEHDVSSSLEVAADNETYTGYYASVTRPLTLPPMWSSPSPSNSVGESAGLPPSNHSQSLGPSEPPAGDLIGSMSRTSSDDAVREGTTKMPFCGRCEIIGWGALSGYRHTHPPFQCSSLDQFTSESSGRECSFETPHATIFLWHLAREHSIKSSERADSLATAMRRQYHIVPKQMVEILSRLRVAIKTSEQLRQKSETPPKGWRSIETLRYMAIVASVIHHKLHLHDDLDVSRCLPYFAAQIYGFLDVSASDIAWVSDIGKHLLGAMEAWVVYYKDWFRFSGDTFFHLVAKLQDEVVARYARYELPNHREWQQHGLKNCPCGLFNAETGNLSTWMESESQKPARL